MQSQKFQRISLNDFGGFRKVTEEDEVWDRIGLPNSFQRENFLENLKEFKEINRKVFRELSLEVKPGHSDDKHYIKFIGNENIGSLPLKSIRTRNVSTIISVEPRFDWKEISIVLEELGWDAPIEFFPEFESVAGLNKVPSWVLAGKVLRSIRKALKRPAEDHNYSQETQSQLKGSVNWSKYSKQQIPKGHKHKLPCHFPELSIESPAHRYLKGITQYLKNELSSNRSIASRKEQRIADEILRILRSTPSEFPSQKDLDNLPSRGPWKRYQDAYEKCKWIVLGKGLGSGSSGYGIPWTIAMDEMYERWMIEGVERWTERKGGKILSTMKGGTSEKNIRWFSYPGSLKSLVPDAIAKIGNKTVIFDAKYKRHYQILRNIGWKRMKNSNSEEAKEHRDDIHQILSYSATVEGSSFCFLIYPVDLEWYVDKGDSLPYILGEVSEKTRLGLLPLPLGGREVLDKFQRTIDHIFEMK